MKRSRISGGAMTEAGYGMGTFAGSWAGSLGRAAALALGLGLATAAWAAEDPDWPCIQRLVPTVSAAAMWAGPPFEEEASGWQKDAEVKELAIKIASRRTPLEDAKTAIETFTGGLGAEKDRRLTLLFDGALTTINRERASIIGGIKRYAKRQRGLAVKIEREFAELNELPQDGTPEQQARRRSLEEQQLWDTRIHQEREWSLTYICEQPVLLEQRLFSLAREIMTYLD